MSTACKNHDDMSRNEAFFVHLKKEYFVFKNSACDTNFDPCGSISGSWLQWKAMMQKKESALCFQRSPHWMEVGVMWQPALESGLYVGRHFPCAPPPSLWCELKLGQKLRVRRENLFHLSLVILYVRILNSYITELEEHFMLCSAKLKAVLHALQDTLVHSCLKLDTNIKVWWRKWACREESFSLRANINILSRDLWILTDITVWQPQPLTSSCKW